MDDVENENATKADINSLAMWIETLAKCLVENETLSKEDLIDYMNNLQIIMTPSITKNNIIKTIAKIEKW